MSPTASPSQPNGGNALASRIIRTNLILFALFLVAILAVSYAVVEAINRSATRNLAQSYSVGAAEKFFSFLYPELILVQKASRSNGVTNWFADETDPEKRMAAFHEMMDYTNIFADLHLYFGIVENGDEYSIKGRVPPADFIPLTKLSPSNPRDVWYFECIASPHDYVLKFDNDKDTDMWKLWINHKVMADETLVGVFCSGRPVQQVYHSMFADFADKKARGYVIDSHGTILMDSTFAELYAILGLLVVVLTDNAI
jgi:hypothetical protein